MGMKRNIINDESQEFEELKNKVEILTEEVNVLKQYKINVRGNKLQRQRFSLDIYEFVISETYRHSWTHSFRGSKLRIALMLLALTGLTITKLLLIKVYKVKPLFKSSYYQDFFTPKGVKVIQDRKKDFKILTDFKESDAYIFTAENSQKPLKQEVLTRIINQFLKSVCQKHDNKLTLTSNSFKSGFLDKLWLDIKNIEFVQRKLF